MIKKAASDSHADPDKIENTMVQDVQKPATLNLNEKRKKAQNFKEIAPTTPTNITSLGGSPKLPRHQKIRDLEGSRTPSPSSVSRKSSFASLFKVCRKFKLPFYRFYCTERISLRKNLKKKEKIILSTFSRAPIFIRSKFRGLCFRSLVSRKFPIISLNLFDVIKNSAIVNLSFD